MKLRTIGTLSAALAVFAPAISHADVTPYSQSFETLAADAPGALTADGWKIFGNVFNADGSYAYGYGVFGAPNGPSGFSAIVSGEGGPAQGAQQMSVYNDYSNVGAHLGGQLVEALVFQEQTVGAADTGQTWIFRFDAKRGNLAAPTVAEAFIKTLNPLTGFNTTQVQSISMTNVSSDWGTFVIPFTVTAGAGQLLQFGFSSKTGAFAPSGVFYDNISLAPIPEPSTYALMIGGLGLLGWMRRRRAA